MNEIITSYVKWVLILSVISYGAIYTLFIVPAIKVKRKIYWSDWFGLNFNWFSYLGEYKEVGIEKGMSLIFYKICWGILWFAAVNIILGFLVMMSIGKLIGFNHGVQQSARTMRPLTPAVICMKIYILPSISIIMSFLYYLPWIGETTRAKLGPYIISFLWFLGAWIIAVIYAVLAFKARKTNPSLKQRYLIGLVMLITSYAIVWIGIFNGYMVSV